MLCIQACSRIFTSSLFLTSLSISPPTSLSFSLCSGLYLMSSSEDTTVKIWDLREGQLLYTLRGHEPSSSSSTHGSSGKGAPTACAFSPGAGTFLASGGADKRVLVWKTNLDEGAASSLSGDGPASEYLEASTPLVTEKPFTSSSSSFSGRQAAASPRTTAMKASPAQPLRPTNRVNKGLMTSSQSGRGGAEMHHKEYRVDDVREGHQTFTASPPPPHVSTTSSIPPAAVPPPPPLTSSSAAAPPPSMSRDALPEVLTSTLDHIVGQLDMLTRTMQILEARVSHTEDRIAAFAHVMMHTHLRRKGGGEWGGRLQTPLCSLPDSILRERIRCA